MTIKLARLSPAFDTQSFTCEDSDLDDFLKNDALGYQEQFLANTTLMLVNNAIVCYFSLAADSIRLTRDETDESGISRLRDYPALKIARLATDKRFQEQGYGTKALEWCVGLAQHLNDEDRHDGLGCRFVTVDAYPQSVSFYKKFGFVENVEGVSKKRSNISLRFDVLENTVDIAP